MCFENVNQQDQCPKRSETEFKKRNVFKLIVKTWIQTQNSNWFDTKEIYEMLEPDLIQKLRSRSTGQKPGLQCKYLFSVISICFLN